ncbi:MAG TPA: hypothetical protein VJX70_05995 [Candidatus Acidoferrum sp.]|nr:hypothetical protein [Candidatus Acidoferrum sp.]
MKNELQESGSGLASRLLGILSVGWMLLVLATFLLIRVVGSQTFQSLHLLGKAR